MSFNQDEMMLGKNEEHIGLGLSISKKIAQNFDGDIDFISELNAGSTFFFSMNLQEDSCDSPEPPQSLRVKMKMES